MLQQNQRSNGAQNVFFAGSRDGLAKLAVLKSGGIFTGALLLKIKTNRQTRLRTAVLQQNPRQKLFAQSVACGIISPKGQSPHRGKFEKQTKRCCGIVVAPNKIVAHTFQFTARTNKKTPPKFAPLQVAQSGKVGYAPQKVHHCQHNVFFCGQGRAVRNVFARRLLRGSTNGVPLAFFATAHARN